MLWIFERGTEETLSLETRYDNESAEFVLVIRRPSGQKWIERFKDTASFRERLEVLETQLEAERWQQQEGPALLYDGWKTQ